jgi:hypothetical protein
VRLLTFLRYGTTVPLSQKKRSALIKPIVMLVLNERAVKLKTAPRPTRGITVDLVLGRRPYKPVKELCYLTKRPVESVETRLTSLPVMRD